MARTKAQACKAMEGKAPRKELLSSESGTFTTTDHTFNKINIASSARSCRNSLGYFPFQVYLLSSAGDLTMDDAFPSKLEQYLHSNDAAIRFNENCDWRLDIYTLPQASILDCIEHHEREKVYRKQRGRGPIMLNRKELLIVDGYDWEAKGLIAVHYTAELLGRDASERKLENHVNDPLPGWGYEEEEQQILPGIRQDLVAERHKDANSLAENVLQFVWYDEGHEWCMHSLIERNVAMGWPYDAYLLELNGLGDAPLPANITRGYLPSETKPRLEEEEENDDDETMNVVDLEDRVTFGERCDPETGVPLSIVLPSRPCTAADYLLLPVYDLASITTTEGVDAVGLTCTNCNRSCQTLSPAFFSYNLYVVGDTSQSPQVLFALLDQGLLKRVPWCLHVYHVCSLYKALEHFDIEIAERSSHGRRPLSYVGAAATEQPHAHQPQSHIFVYLDANAPLQAGPRVVTSNSTSTDSGIKLDVLHTGGWDNAAQMLFTYLLLCIETPGIMAPLSPLSDPIFTLTLTVTDHCPRHRSSEPCRAPDVQHLNYTFLLDGEAPYPVTVNDIWTILDSNPYRRDEFLYIEDAETQLAVELPSINHYISGRRVIGAEDLQHLAFPVSPRLFSKGNIVTLEPGKEFMQTVPFTSSRLHKKYQNTLSKGNRYRIRVKDDQKLPRWIWGDLEHLKGPFGLRPIQVLENVHSADFDFDGPVDNGQQWMPASCSPML